MKTATSGLYTDIKNILEQARANAVKAVNFSMVIAYWEIGKRVVEEEQQGQDRASYGKAVLNELSKKLTSDFGQGFSVVSLENFRKFYMVFSEIPNSSALRRNLDTATTSPPLHKSEAEKSSALRTIFGTSIPYALRRELSWTHYRSIMKVEKTEARNYYIQESARQNWSTRTSSRRRRVSRRGPCAA